MEINNSNTARPLVSYLLFSYNHEKFIQQAVRSALQQIYEPLEIIISDDCSTDNTYEIIKSEVAKYSGRNNIIVRQNRLNLGAINHINELWNEAKGEWIVVAAGDDISVPDRTTKIVEMAQRNNDVNLICSDSIPIDTEGNEIKNIYFEQSAINPIISTIDMYVNKDIAAPHGATMAYSRALIKKFPPLPKDCVYEDSVLFLRALLIGKSAQIKIPLVRYRTHENQTTNANTNDVFKNTRKYENLVRGCYISSHQNLLDFQSTSSMINSSNASKIEKLLKDKLRFNARLKNAIFWFWPLRILPYLFICFDVNKTKIVGTKTNLAARAMLPKFLLHFLKRHYSRDGQKKIIHQ